MAISSKMRYIGFGNNVMRNRLLTYILGLFLLLGGLNTAPGQSVNYADNKSEQKEKPKFLDLFEKIDKQRSDIHEVNFIGGYSFHSTRGFWGKIPGAELSIFSLRYNRKLFTFRQNHVVEYVGEAILAANYSVKPSIRWYKAGSYNGFGVTPLGFQLNLNEKNVVQPFFKSSTGFMYFNEAFPGEYGVRFNFTLELGTGLEFVISQNLSLSLGYKYHHMSNGHLGQINPGVDSNIFHTGITIF